MNQKEHWSALKPFLKGWDALRVEDARAVGVPDVNFALGWLELKQVARPKKDHDAFDNFGMTDNQARWMLRRDKAGGLCFVSLAIADEFRLLRGASFAYHLLHEKTSYADLKGHTLAVGLGRYRKAFEDCQQWHYLMEKQQEAA